MPSYLHLQWSVQLNGRIHVVDVAWPGFANQIAVDGQVVERWRMPSNNWRTGRSFQIDGVSCRIIRQRSGWARFDHRLQVDDDTAVVRSIEPAGRPLVPSPPGGACLSKLVATAILLGILCTVVCSGFLASMLESR